MSEEQLKAFLEAVKADAGLQEKLKTATDADADAVVAIAMAAGFVFTAEDLKKPQAGVTEEELEGVAGGCNAFMTGMADYIYSVFHPGQGNGQPCSH
ncbi:hypothetical protein SynWH8101_1817 [Synechococcus sp. WH 8101]|nr:Nif11-like leader peptide family natural product precursor [Synechococcus sp. WH 8101]QBE69399.1 hypothetical protein SynWH8101_1817 [Synechococcus sp. WH 8101]QNI45647.1 nif11-like leader peptide domain protein [Synechococcus sp. WH 8101]